MRYFSFLAALVMVLGVALNAKVVAGDLEDCGKYSLAEDYEQAFPACRRSAEQGAAEAQAALGVMYYEGIGVTQDYQEAVKWYRLAAEQGVAEAQNNLGVMYDDGIGVTQDYQEAVKWWRLSAEQGVAEAKNNLGVMYATGKGVTQDYQEAYIWFALAAANGYAAAAVLRDIVATELSRSDLRLAQQEAAKRQQEIENQ